MVDGVSQKDLEGPPQVDFLKFPSLLGVGMRDLILDLLYFVCFIHYSLNLLEDQHITYKKLEVRVEEGSRYKVGQALPLLAVAAPLPPTLSPRNSPSVRGSAEQLLQGNSGLARKLPVLPGGYSGGGGRDNVHQRAT